MKNTLQFFIAVVAFAASLCAQTPAPERIASMKADLAGQIDAMKKQAQVMVDSIYSFGELGFQEFETSKYLTGILEKEGFKVERGIAGIPTAFLATWVSGKPVIALGSDIDDDLHSKPERRLLLECLHHHLGGLAHSKNSGWVAPPGAPRENSANRSAHQRD